MRYLLYTAVLIPLISGCATPAVPSLRGSASRSIPGIYHKVARGETLWKISKWYGVTLDDLVMENRLHNARLIKVGQRLFIPNAKERITQRTTACDVDSNPFVWPIKGKVFGYFGAERHSVKNKGLDIFAKDGEPVRASRGGKVVFCSEGIRGFEKTVIIDHGDEFQTVYAHNSDICVLNGDYVKQNDMIARAGKPLHSHIAMLHFEIRKKGKPKNPLHFLP